EQELDEIATSEEYSVIQIEGKRKVKRKSLLYNLDAIISVGYRVNSIRGTQFRIWANKVLKEYLLKGYAINQRIETLENKVYSLEKKSSEFDFHIKTSLPPHEGIFFDGQIYDAYEKVSSFIKEAKLSIILIANYINETVLTLLSKRKTGVKTTIYTQ
ncbi:MAG: DNA-binding protein, partial [Armatimonadetes bacterium CG07_land_8_20_14_0_80_40_9]